MSTALQQVSETVSDAQLARLSAMSGFQKIVLLNELAGNMSNGGWEAIEAQFKLIESEFKELKDAITARDIENLRGEIADMRVVVLGMAHRAGTDADADLHEVVLSNLTKFDPSDNPEAIRRTVAKHLSNGVETVQIEVADPLREEGSDRKLYVTRSSYNQHGNDGKSFPQGKWLKSANFCEPEFDPLPQHVINTLYPERVVKTVDGNELEASHAEFYGTTGQMVNGVFSTRVGEYEEKAVAAE